MKKTIAIEGMTCQNCVKHVTEALESVAGAGAVAVDLDKKSAEVEAAGAVDDDALKNAVTRAGYTVISIS